MAEVVGFEIAKIFLEKSVSGAVKEACSFLPIKSHIKNLEEIKPIIEAWLLDADATQLTNSTERLVFEQLIRALEEVHDSLVLRAARAARRQAMSKSHPIRKVFLLFSTSSNPIVCAFRDARQVKALIEELDRVARKNNQLGNLLRLSYETRSQMQALCLEKGAFISEEVIGRENDRDKVIRMLFDSSNGQETFCMISIVGIGGMGKTTLAQYVFSDDRVKRHFDVRLWVYIPQVLIEKEVMQNMVAFAIDGNPNMVSFAMDGNIRQYGMPQLQSHLLAHIAGKKIHLVLDNVWDHEHLSLHWQRLRNLLGFCAARSMVLTTTRSAGVAKTMGTVDPYMLMDLAADDSWHLFKRIAFTECQERGVEMVGKEITQMCPNVPLVVSSIAYHLKGMRTVKEWRDFKDKLAHLSCLGQAPSVMQILKLSYDQLHPKLKLCLAYCSLFPKGFRFEKIELIHLWIALGYVEPQVENQSLVNVAENHTLHLKNLGFFLVNLHEDEHDPDYLKMHDVIHDLVRGVAGFKYKMVCSERHEFDYERIHHVSFQIDNMKWLEEDFLFSMLLRIKKQLQSLLALHSRYEVGKVPLFKLDLSKFECLRVLSLKGIGLREVPRTIGKLIPLRYLDLSFNRFRKLSNSITQLVNLIYLNLSNCTELLELSRDLNKLENLFALDLSHCSELRELPRDISKLTNLLSLKLYYCSNFQGLPKGMNKLVKLRELGVLGCPNLRHMPLALENMTDLQLLALFPARGQSSSSTDPSNPYDSDDDDVARLSALSCLNNLKGLAIVVDGSCSSELEATAANLQGKEKLASLGIIFAGGSSRDNEIMLEGFQPHANLRHLYIGGYGGERLPSWINDKDYYSNLTDIGLYKWKARSCLSFSRLPHLKTLTIIDSLNLEYLTIMDTDTDANANSSAAPLLPRLEQLVLKGLPNLQGVQRMHRSITSSNDEYFLHGVGASAFPRLLNLELISLGLDVVPEEFRRLPSIESLFIEDCKHLKEIEEWIDTLSSLKILNVKNCPGLTLSPKHKAKISSSGRSMGNNVSNAWHCGTGGGGARNYFRRGRIL